MSDPSELRMLMEAQLAAELEYCPTRFVVEMMPGMPDKDGRYLCEVEIDGHGSDYRAEVWKGGRWVTLGGYSRVVKWGALPPLKRPTG